MQILERVIEESYAHLRKNIVIINQENQGLPMARKTGISQATGEYILFADPDDWLSTNAIEEILGKIDETEADIVYFDLVKEYGHRQSVKQEREYTAATKERWIENIFNYKSFGYSVTKCFHRSLYTDNRIFTPILGMHEDIYLMIQIIYYAKSIARLPMALYHYRKTNKGSMCSQSMAARHIASSRNLLNLYQNYMDDIANSPIRNVAGGIVLRAGWHSVLHRYDFTTEYPWLPDAIRKARFSSNYQVAMPLQVITKIAYMLKG
jgi:glycosyltransferase involved in cell wall biosynthesis